MFFLRRKKLGELPGLANRTVDCNQEFVGLNTSAYFGWKIAAIQFEKQMDKIKVEKWGKLPFFKVNNFFILFL